MGKGLHRTFKEIETDLKAFIDGPVKEQLKILEDRIRNQKLREDAEKFLNQHPKRK